MRVLLMVLLSAVRAAAVASDLTLTLNISGLWRGAIRYEDCPQFAQGYAIFAGMPELASLFQANLCAFPPQPLEQYIWQDCLEMTITSGDVLHHMVHDGVYETVDFHASGRPIRYTASIEIPLPHEAALGATAVSVFRGVDSNVTNGTARRFVSSSGRLHFYQELAPGHGGLWVMDRVDDTRFPQSGCSGYEPDRCVSRSYTDTSSEWTAACCDTTGDAAVIATLRMPPPASYGGGYNPKWRACDGGTIPPPAQAEGLREYIDIGVPGPRDGAATDAADSNRGAVVDMAVWASLLAVILLLIGGIAVCTCRPTLSPKAATASATSTTVKVVVSRASEHSSSQTPSRQTPSRRVAVKVGAVLIAVVVLIVVIVVPVTVRSRDPVMHRITVAAVSGRTERHQPEPYKQTTLCVLPDCGEQGGEDFCWTITYAPWADELEPGEVPTLQQCTGKASQLVHTFTRPGYYNVTVSTSQGALTATVNNVYARRELRNLTASEWDMYVDALWTLVNTSTEEGRARFTCPSGRQADFHTHAFFVALHGAASANTTCDQLHFSLMQEFAHLGWNTLLEKAMQCVHPAVSLVYWNEPLDARTYLDTSVGVRSLLRSPVWGPQFLGGASNYDPDDGTNPHYWVRDGRFAYFPLRPNRSGICTELSELFAELAVHCEAWVSLDERTGFRGTKEETGFWYTEPRPLEAYQYVSRRTGYVFGDNTIGMANFPTDSRMQEVVTQDSLEASLRLISGGSVHGKMHHWASGVWDPPEKPVSNATKAQALSSLFTWQTFVWTFDARSRFDRCYNCSATQCECAPDSEARGCWSGSITQPSDAFDVKGTIPSGSYWEQHLQYMRGYAGLRRDLFGCEAGVTGTFQRSAVANQDPAFYLHHAFTFTMVDRAMRFQRDRPGGDRGPYWGLDKFKESQVECSGNNWDDVTVFAHLVPYSVGQVVGSRHTWSHILRMWDFDRRHFRWVLEGEA